MERTYCRSVPGCCTVATRDLCKAGSTLAPFFSRVPKLFAPCNHSEAGVNYKASTECDTLGKITRPWYDRTLFEMTRRKILMFVNEAQEEMIRDSRKIFFRRLPPRDFVV